MTYANAAKKSKRIEELLVVIKDLSQTALTEQSKNDILSFLNEYKNIIDRALNENFEVLISKKKGEV